MACAIKRVGKRWEDTIDKLFSKVGKGLNAADEKITQTLSGGRFDRTFTVSEVQKAVGELISDHRTAVSEISEAAGDIKSFLEHITVEQSHALSQALGGDLDPKELDLGTKGLYDKFRRIIDANADALVEAGALNKKYAIKDYVKRYYTQYLDDAKGSAKVYFDKRYKSRKGLSHDDRIALGMIEDADFVISNTIAAQKIQILKAQTMKALADEFAFKGENPPDDFVRISDKTSATGVYTYGDLAGKYVPKDVAVALEAAKLTKEGLGILEKHWYPIIDHIKVNVTIKNPVTHLYNVGANFLLAGLNGNVSSLGRVLKMAAVEKSKFSDLVTLANKFGLNSFLNDVEKVHFDNDSARGAGVIKSLLKNIYLSADSKTGHGARFLYDWEDKIFKLAAFMDEMESARKDKGSALTMKEKRHAYKRASEVYVDYNTPIPSVLSTLDKTGLSPFMHYVYKSTPATAKVIAKHPIRFAVMQTLITAGGASALLNDDDDAYKPKWAENRGNLFGTKEWTDLGNSWYINSGRLMPAMKFGAIDLSGGFIGGVIRIIGGKSPLGYNISSEYDPISTKILKRFGTLIENYAPPVTIGRYGQKVGKSLAGVEQLNYYKENMTPEEIIKRALGVRRFNESKEITTKMKRAANEYKDRAKDADTHTRNELWAIYTKEMKSLQSEGKKKSLHVKKPRSPRGGSGSGFGISGLGLTDLSL